MTEFAVAIDKLTADLDTKVRQVGEAYTALTIERDRLAKELAEMRGLVRRLARTIRKYPPMGLAWTDKQTLLSAARAAGVGKGQ